MNEKLRVMETFAGIGAQHKAIKNACDDYFRVEKICEWDARAIISYANIHYNFIVDNILLANNIHTEKDINNFLSKKIFSLNSKKPSRLVSKNINFKKMLIASTIITNNHPNILNLKGKDIENIDLLTYSFPCQGLSIANMGRAKGIKKDVDSTSNLIWQIERVLSEAKNNKQKLPKYLLLENVTQLISKSHIDDYEEWKKILLSMGYKTFTYVLNSEDFGMVQKRKRLFAISINDSKISWTQEKIQNIIDSFKSKLNEEQRKDWISNNIQIKPHPSQYHEYILATPNKTPSRLRMAIENKTIDSNLISWLNTLTTKQDRHPNIGMIDFEHNDSKKLNKRFVTPREAYKIMGFQDNDFDKLKNMWISDKNKFLTTESLYRQAGNSIAVKVLEAIFKTIKQIDIEENKYEKNIK